MIPKNIKEDIRNIFAKEFKNNKLDRDLVFTDLESAHFSFQSSQDGMSYHHTEDGECIFNMDHINSGIKRSSHWLANNINRFGLVSINNGIHYLKNPKPTFWEKIEDKLL